MLLAAGLLLHHSDSPFDIRGVFFGSSYIDIGTSGHILDHWFKWRKFATRMDCCDPKFVGDVESEHFFESLEDLSIGPDR